GPAMQDTIAGTTQVFFSSTAAALPQIKAGQLRALAVTTPTRNAALPDVPAVAETLPGYDVTLWHGIVGPKGMPPAIVERINAEVAKALALPAAVDVLKGDGVSPAPGTPAQFRAQIAKGLALWGKVAKDAGVKPE
ncbi:MAG: tripartite tricarboxylate transporter substrate binding protein, partial [Proteobacteria bacterium]|nr:tripartite tricarboxylate transporter substrate binding protein [Pseudomonadota bacterium]